eukprot:391566-Hanusia_phi.AAC.2
MHTDINTASDGPCESTLPGCPTPWLSLSDRTLRSDKPDLRLSWASRPGRRGPPGRGPSDSELRPESEAPSRNFKRVGQYGSILKRLKNVSVSSNLYYMYYSTKNLGTKQIIITYPPGIGLTVSLGPER